MAVPDSQSTDADVGREGSGSDAAAESIRPAYLRRPPRWRSLLSLLVLGYFSMLALMMLMETRLVYPGVYHFESGNAAGRMALPPAADRTIPAEQTTLADRSGAAEQPLSDQPEWVERRKRIDRAKIVDFEYTSEDGIELTGRLLARPRAPQTVLFFHGNGSHAVWLDRWCRRLADTFDATVLVAEYRGFGGSGPAPDEAGVLADARAAMKALCRRQDVRPEEVIVFGRSLGGGCAVEVAAELGARGLVLDRTFDSAVNVAASRFPFIPVRLLMRNQFDSAARIDAYHGPLVQVHGTRDAMIPLAHGRALYEQANPPKQWIEVPGLGHNHPLDTATLYRIANALDVLVEQPEVFVTEKSEA